jgi:hypothetical protein
MGSLRNVFAWFLGLAVFGAIALFASRIGGQVAGKAQSIAA